MKNLPKGMIADRDNQVYYDTETHEFYMIEWEDGGNNDYAHRHYIGKLGIVYNLKTKQK